MIENITKVHERSEVIQFINLQLFGGGGGSSGGTSKGSIKSPNNGDPNSSYIWYKDGKKHQKRWYDKDGNPKLDKDYTDHGNPKRHPHVPHYHDWENGTHGDGYWIDKHGNKHYE